MIFEDSIAASIEAGAPARLAPDPPAPAISITAGAGSDEAGEPDASSSSVPQAVRPSTTTAPMRAIRRERTRSPVRRPASVWGVRVVAVIPIGRLLRTRWFPVRRTFSAPSPDRLSSRRTGRR